MKATRPSRPRRLRRTAATLLLLASLPMGCAAFDDREADGGYLDYAQAARLCARIFDCSERLGVDFALTLMQSTGIPAETRSFSACMSWFAGPISERPLGLQPQRKVLTGLANASSCEEANDLLLVKYLLDPGSGGTEGDKCMSTENQCLDGGATAIDCEDRTRIRCDDARVFEEGSQCELSSDIPGWCATTACGSGLNRWLNRYDVPTCQDDQVLRVCDQEIDLNKASNTEMHLRCDGFGLTCKDALLVRKATLEDVTMGICTNLVSSDDNELNRSGVCDKPRPEGCQIGGTSVVVCFGTHELSGLAKQNLRDETLSVVQSVFDCEAPTLPSGFKCHDAGPSTALAYCARTDVDACSPEDYADVRCDGDALAVCLAGRKDTVDCASAGLKCRDKEGGSPASAHCAFPE